MNLKQETNLIMAELKDLVLIGGLPLVFLLIGCLISLLFTSDAVQATVVLFSCLVGAIVGSLICFYRIKKYL